MTVFYSITLHAKTHLGEIPEPVVILILLWRLPTLLGLEASGWRGRSFGGSGIILFFYVVIYTQKRALCCTGARLGTYYCGGYLLYRV